MWLRSPPLTCVITRPKERFEFWRPYCPIAFPISLMCPPSRNRVSEKPTRSGSAFSHRRNPRRDHESFQGSLLQIDANPEDPGSDQEHGCCPSPGHARRSAETDREGAEKLRRHYEGVEPDQVAHWIMVACYRAGCTRDLVPGKTFPEPQRTWTRKANPATSSW